VVNWKSLEGISSCLYLSTEVEIRQVGTDETEEQVYLFSRCSISDSKRIPSAQIQARCCCIKLLFHTCTMNHTALLGFWSFFIIRYSRK
jgi:hypothetical protein